MRKSLRKVLRKVKSWLDEDVDSAAESDSVPFDNSYNWLSAGFTKLMKDSVCAQRPQYLWGMLQGAALAKVLGKERISTIEFGVASGAGLVVMEHIAERCEEMIGIGIDVFGFDTGTGYTALHDYRDMPYKLIEGYYPCDKEELQKRLHRATMKYGLVKETVESLIHSPIAPVGFVGFDFSIYSATRDALRIFEANYDLLLPRVPCSFRSAIGKDRCEYTGELLAISEFNSQHEMRKVCAIRGMNYFIPRQFDGHWTQWLFTLHIFDHPLYNVPDAYMQSASIDITGREIFVEAKSAGNLKAARTRTQGSSQ